jgi:hypothetical protein
MTGPELEKFRESLNMDRVKFGAFLGYTGLPSNNGTRVRRYEQSDEPIPLYLARYVWLLQCWIRRTGGLPHFPEWDYYVYDHSPDRKEAEDNAD